MLLLTSCTTLQKQVKKETVEIDTVYFPVFPDPLKNGIYIPKCYENIVIADIFYEKVEVLPYWYWLLIVQYVNDTEAAIQSLVPK